MGMQTTTTNLTYARNDYLKVGHSFIFDRVGDMIYYVLTNNDIAETRTNTLTLTDTKLVIGSRTGGSAVDLGSYETACLVTAQYTDSATLTNTTDYVGCSAIFDLKLGRAITLASGGGYGFATIWANLEVDKAINATGAQSAAWMTIWADAAGDDAHIRGTSRLQVLDLAIVTGADFDAGATTKIYGLRIDSSANASATLDGEFAAINIEAAGTKKDWTIGIDINDCTTGIASDAPILIGTDGSPITITTADYQFRVDTTVDTAASGWFNAVAFDTELTAGQNLTGNAQLVGVQAYARINTGSTVNTTGGICGLSSCLVTVGTVTATMGVYSAITAVLQVATSFTGASGTEIAGLIIQNQTAGTASITANKYYGLWIYSPSPSYLHFDYAINIQSRCDVGIHFHQCPTNYVFKWEERRSGIVGYSAGAPLNDINETANQGFLKVLVEGQTRYIALYATKT